MQHVIQRIGLVMALMSFFIFQACQDSDSADPQFSGFSPVQGSGGTVVTLSGANFGTDPTQVTVTFNGLAAPVKSVTPSTITVTVPHGTATGKVSVTAAGQTFISAQDFIYEKSVYIGGYERRADSKMVAKYWQNGKAVPLSDSAAHARVNKIFIANGTMYAAGMNGSKACYWKNGELIDVGAVDGESEIMDLVVVGDDVYAAGFQYVNGEDRQYGVVWKNGVASLLRETVSGSYSAGINQLAISGGNVYAAGYATNSQGNYEAVYWKNGVKHIVSPEGSDYGQATGILADGDQIHVIYTARISGNYIPQYWINGTATTLSGEGDSPFTLKMGRDAAGNIYALYKAGFKAFVRKNENEFSYDLLTGGDPTALVVDGDDVYISGTTYGDEVATARYWKNGQSVSLSSGTTQAYGNSILIQ